MIKFGNFEEVFQEAQSRNKKLYEICQLIEEQNTEIPVEEIRKKVKCNLDAMEEAIREGLKSNEKSMSGMCGDDCAKLVEMYKHCLLYTSPSPRDA